MSEQLQLRRGTSAQVAAFTGAQGEVAVDTTFNRLVVQDNTTVGGFSAGIERRTAIADAAYSALPTDRIVAYSSLTAARAVTLPAAANYPTGARLMVVDETGACSSANTITVTRAGSDLIDGQTTTVINSSYGFVGLESDGISKWTLIESMSTVARSPKGASIQFGVIEFLTATLSGSSYVCATQLPSPALILSVGAYVTTAITGSGSPTGFNVGDQGSQGDGSASATRFANGVGLAAGSSSAGIAGQPFYNFTGTNILLAPSGGSSPSFTGGVVRLSIHLAFCNPSTS